MHARSVCVSPRLQLLPRRRCCRCGTAITAAPCCSSNAAACTHHSASPTRACSSKSCRQRHSLKCLLQPAQGRRLQRLMQPQAQHNDQHQAQRQRLDANEEHQADHTNTYITASASSSDPTAAIEPQQQQTHRERASAAARAQFAYFANAAAPVFLENAGGSQVPNCVADAIRSYMLTCYAQLGAGHALSVRAGGIVDDAHAFLRTFMNAEGAGHVVLGSSTSQLCANLASCYGDIVHPGDVIVVQQAGHEANVGPWVRLAKATGAELRWWLVDPQDFTSSLNALRKLVTDRTCIVAIVHVSNILGEVQDVKAVSELVKKANPRARIVVDGVAYAPHLPIDVQQFECDWYVFSTYKTWGPHMAALYGSNTAFQDIHHCGGGLNHYFVPSTDHVYKFELGSVSHEGCAGLLGLQQFLGVLAQYSNTQSNLAPQKNNYLNGDWESPPLHHYMQRSTIEAAYKTIAHMEAPLTKALVKFLESKPDIRILGPGLKRHVSRQRVSTVSFVHAHISSHKLTAYIQDKGFAIRNGHMYAPRLVEALKLRGGIEEGVVRISMLHYNTLQEVEALISVVDQALTTLKPADL